MQDTIIIAKRKSFVNADLPFVRCVITTTDYVPNVIHPSVKYIIKVEQETDENCLNALRHSADDEHISIGIYEKSDILSSVRRFIYSFAGVKEPDIYGAVIFPVTFTELKEKAASYDTIRLLSLAEQEKYKSKRIVMVGSDKRSFSFSSFKYLFSVFLSSHILKYLFSSVVAFVIDYVLLLSFNSILPVASLEIAAFIAWCVSSFVNFVINRSFVFSSKSPLKASLIEYYSLAGIVFLVKTYVFIEIMTRILNIPLAVSKPCAEVLLFIINYFIQKKFIFSKRKKRTDQADKT